VPHDPIAVHYKAAKHPAAQMRKSECVGSAIIGQRCGVCVCVCCTVGFMIKRVMKVWPIVVQRCPGEIEKKIAHVFPEKSLQYAPASHPKVGNRTMGARTFADPVRATWSVQAHELLEVQKTSLCKFLQQAMFWLLIPSCPADSTRLSVTKRSSTVTDCAVQLVETCCHMRN
jgi:hypothetical protein